MPQHSIARSYGSLGAACLFLQLCLIIPLAGCSGRRDQGKPAAPPAPVPTVLAFQDVTQSAGISVKPTNGASGHKYFPEIMGSGCAFIDYNADGKPDIYIANGAPMPGYTGDPNPTGHLYRNNGDGTFADVTKQARLDVTFYGMGCAVGDYDNNGFDDLYVSAALGPGRLFHNNGDGTFADVTRSAGVDDHGYWGSSCAWLDYDRDGKLDLFICNYVRYRSLKDNIPCIFRPGVVSYCTPRVYTGESCVLYHNEGGGRFKDVTRAAGAYTPLGKSLGVAIWDFDGDNWPDIFVANDGAPNLLLRNNGRGAFTDVGAESGIAYGESGETRAGMGIDVNDELQDGKTSMLVTNFSAEMMGLYRQTKPDVFRDDALAAGIGQPTLLTLGFGVLFFDADNNAVNDIALVNGHVQDDIALFQTNREFEQHPMLFEGDGKGSYREVGQIIGGPFAQKYVGRGLASGDFDGDGRLDLLMTVNNGPPHLMRNTSTTANHWIAFRLRGGKSNRSGIGAKVTVSAGGRAYRSTVRSGSSYLSASDLAAHFGLGLAAQVDSVTIAWPSGKLQEFGPRQVDRTIVVTEP